MVLHLLFFEFLNRLVQLMRASNISDERIPAAASKIRFASRDGADWISIPSTIPQVAMNWDISKG